MNESRSISTLFQKAISRPRKMGGELIFLILALTILAPVFTVVEFINISQFDFNALPGVTTWAVAALVVGDLIIRPYGVYVGIALWRIRPNAVKLAKEYFILNIVICFVQLLFVAQAAQVDDSAIRECMIAIVVSIMWFSFLNKSQRVKDTYGPLTQERPLAVTESASATRKPESFDIPINVSETYTLVSSPGISTEPKASGTKAKKSPVVTVPTKRLGMRRASALTAFALILVFAAGGYLFWYRGHLNAPITAEFIKLETNTHSGPIHTTLHYQLHNHTGDSYLFERLLVEARMDDGRLTPVVYDSDDKDEHSMLVPMILPAKDDVHFILTVRGDFSNGGGNVSSFVLFDDKMRFRIDLPKGW